MAKKAYKNIKASEDTQYKKKSYSDIKASDYSVGIDDSYVKSFVNDSQNYFTNMSNASKDIGYSNASQKYQDSSSAYLDLLDRSRQVRAYYNSQKNNMNTDDYNSMVNYLDSFDKSSEDVVKYFSNYADFYSKFKSEDDYNRYDMEWLSGNYDSSNMDKAKQRTDYYESNKQKIADLEAQMGGDKLKNNSIYKIYSKIEGTDLNELNKQVEALKAENAQYERTQKVTDEYNRLRENVDFGTDASKRNYNNPTRDAMLEADNEVDNFSTWSSGIVGTDANGDYILADGTTKSHPESLNVPDKLGMFLDASEEDIASAYNELALSNGNYTRTWANVIQEGDTKYWNKLTPGEVSIYYYLYQNEGQEAAYKYLDDMAVTLGIRYNNAVNDMYSQTNDLEKIALGLATLSYGTIGGVYALADDVSHIVRGQDIDPYNTAHRLQNSSTLFRSGMADVADRLTGYAEVPWINMSAGDVVMAIMSSADSKIGGSLFGKGYTVIMSAGAASTEAKKLYEQGASKDQIALGAFAAGLAEGTFEYISLDHFLKETSPTTRAEWFKQVLAQAGVEASEEVLTEISNIFSNALVMKSQSEWEKLLAENEGVAFDAFIDEVGNVVAAGIGGAISGGLMQGIRGGLQLSSYNKQSGNTGYNSVNNGGFNIALNYANENDIGKSNSKLKNSATEVSNKISNKESLTKNDYKSAGKFVDAVNSNIYEQSAKAEIADRMLKENLPNDPKIVDKVYKYINSNADIKIANSDVAAIAMEIMDSPSFNSSVAMRVMNSKNNSARTYVNKEIDRKISNSFVRNMEEEYKGRVSENAKTINNETGETVEIKSINSISNGEMVLNLSDGSTISSNNVDYANIDDAVAYENVLSEGYPVSTANAIINSIKSVNNISVGRYLLGVNEAYKYGKVGYPLSSIKSNAFITDLTESQKKFAYELGKEDSKVETDSAQNVANTNKSNEPKKGKVVLSTSLSTLTERQKASLKTIGKVNAEITHGNVVMFESVLKDGRRVYSQDIGGHKAGEDAANGFYDPRTGTIYLDINAGKNGEGTILWTYAHELAHDVRRNSPKMFKNLADFLMEEYGKKGIDANKLVYGQIARANEHERTLTFDEAYEEVVADSLSQMFTDNNLAEKLARLKAKDQTLWEKIKDFFAKLYERVKKAYEGLDPQTQEAAYVKQMKDSAERLANMFAEAIIDASESNANSDGTSGKKYSFSSMGYSFFNDESISAKDFESGDYKSKDGYKDYVNLTTKIFTLTHDGVSEAKARKEIVASIDGIVRVALASKKAGYDIYDNPEKRSVKDSKKRLLFSSLEPNSDFFTSNDISTICDKRLNFADIYDEIVRRETELGVPYSERFFSNIDNYFYIHKVLADKGLTTPCRQCYVESMRKNLMPMANAFLELITETDINNKKNGQLYQQSGKNKGELKVNNAKIRERVLELLSDYGMEPSDITIDTLTTAEGLAELKIKSPLLYEAFNSFYGQSKPKMPKSATPFRFGELIALLTDDNGNINKRLIDKINSTGGFRLQSYSDFQISNYVDVLQAIFEAGVLGLNGHAYTKVPAFLDATDGTNLKRNISIFMYNDGSEWKLDRNDSFPATTIEDIYSIVNADKTGNTSIIAVSQNADMSSYIMANDNIGYGIPFHKSGLKMDTVRNTIVNENGKSIKGYSNIKDHTKQQTEVWAKTTSDHKAYTKVKNGINIYGEEVNWDFDNKDGLSKNGLIEKNLKSYIDACYKAGYLPKFREYIINNEGVLNKILKYSKELGYSSEDATIDDISFKYRGFTIPYGYYKFIGDFGMFTPDGKASPHDVLSLANYDFDKAVDFFKNSEELRRNETLQQFANGTERQKYRESGLTSEELADIIKQKRKEVVDEIVGKKYSDRETEQYIAKSTKKYGDVEKAAIEHFGTTDNFRTAGYILRDGQMLDFSGVHWLDGQPQSYINDWKKKNDIRQVDHEDVYEAFEISADTFPNDSRKEFINRGNVRVSPEAPGINIASEPTSEQYQKIRELIETNPYKADGFYVDIEDKSKRVDKLTYSGKVNADRVINDIKYFYANGSVRQSSVAQFHNMYSDRDNQYLELAKNPKDNSNELQKMVEDAAIKAGFNSGMLFHGTNLFGFTKIKTTGLEANIDWSPFFATDSEVTAKSYSYDSPARPIKDESVDYEAMAEEANKKLYDAIIGCIMWLNGKAGVHNYFDYDEIQNRIDDLLTSHQTEEGWSEIVYDYLEDKFYDVAYSIDMPDSEMDSELDNFYDSYIKPIITLGNAKNAIFTKWNENSSPSGLYSLYANTDNLYEVDANNSNWNRIRTKDKLTTKEESSAKKRIEKLISEVSNSEFAFDNEVTVDSLLNGYAKRDGDYSAMYWLLSGYASGEYPNFPNAEYKNHNEFGYDIDILYSGKNRAYESTRSIAEWARDNGYNGVKIKNLIDDGGRGSEKVTPATVYIFFNPESQVKSADTVTYDDNGNVIPLSQRFNSDNNDIRYSDRDTYAPTFYSHMSNIIDGIKSEKVGANGVVPYLKGKGVKDEEIKWSGIEAFLDGKKSLTKADLQEFAKNSMLQIVESTLSSKSKEETFDYFYNSFAYYYPEMSQVEFSDNFFNAFGDFQINWYEIIVDNMLSENVINDDQYEALIMEGRAYANGLTSEATHWSEYKTEGGTNYREILFKMPDSYYANRAMNAHWGEKGVLAHARVQDFELPNGRNMLFVEEIQSDWHNEGSKKGYASKDDIITGKTFVKLRESVGEKMSVHPQGFKSYANWFNETAKRADIDLKLESKNGRYYLINMGFIETDVDDYSEFRERLFDFLSEADYEFNSMNSNVPEAPFKNGKYVEYVMKRLIRMAAEDGYDLIGWTTGKMQEDRWSSDYAEGYRIEYDQDIPKFMNKYGKQWGAKVEDVGIVDAGTNFDRSEAYDYAIQLGIVDDRDAIENVIDNLDGTYGVEYYDSEGKLQVETIEAPKSGTSKYTVHAVKITPSMKDTVLNKGQVLYSDRVLMGSVFSGGGTVEAGLVYQMLDKEFAVEYNKQIATVYTDNHGKEHMFVGDVRAFDSKSKNNVFYLHASPVCKNLSNASHTNGEKPLDIETAEATARILEEQMPQVFTVENVKRYINSEAYSIITSKLNELGYIWDVDVYKASDYGNPTKRERMVIRAVKDGYLPPKPSKTRHTSWYEATKDLFDTDLIPSTLVKSKIEAIKNTPGISISQIIKSDKPILIYDTTKSKNITYAMADELAPTLTTKCGDARIIWNGKVYEPTPKFMGRLQGIPDDYKYPKAKTVAFKIIGNGIPTQLTKSVMGGVLDSAYEQTHEGKKLYSERGNGYDGYSMSNNARSAYDNDEKPLSKWSRSELLSIVSELAPNRLNDAKKLTLPQLRNSVLKKTSWHHTSKYYNKTDFYSVDESRIGEIGTHFDYNMMGLYEDTNATFNYELNKWEYDGEPIPYNSGIRYSERDTQNTEDFKNFVGRLYPYSSQYAGVEVPMTANNDVIDMINASSTPDEFADKYIAYVKKLPNVDFSLEGSEDSLRRIAKNSKFVKDEIEKNKQNVGLKVNYRDTSLDSRTLLANALADTAQNDAEKEYISKYQSKISMINEEQNKLTEIRAKIKELSFAKGKRDTEQIKNLQEEATKIANRINTYDKQLLKLESTKALKDVVEREKAIAKKKAQAEAKTALDAYRERSIQNQKELVEKYKERTVKARDRRKDTEIRTKIKKLISDLQSSDFNPKVNSYIPANLMKPVNEVLSAINIDSGRSEKLSTKLAELKVKYDEIANDQKYSIVYDETVSEMVQSLIKMIGDTSIYDMDRVQLEATYTTLKALTHIIKTAIKVRNIETEKNAFEISMEMRNETKAVKNESSNVASRWLLSQLRPETAFERFAGFKKDSMWSKVYRMLDNGQLTKMRIDMEANQIFSDVFADAEYVKSLSDYKNLVDIGLKDDDGETVKITKGMALAIFKSLMNEDNARHIMLGGITVPNIKKYYSGSDDAYGVGHIVCHGIGSKGLAENSHMLSEAKKRKSEALDNEDKIAAREIDAEINKLYEERRLIIESGEAFMDELRANIGRTLNAQDIKFLEDAGIFFDEFSKKELNKTTMELYGFEKAQIENYLPIHTDPNFRTASFEQITKDFNLENSGFMKDRVNASNPIMLEDLAEIINSQIDKVATYCGYTICVKDFGKIYGKSESGFASSLQDTISSKFGNPGKKYIENLLSDIVGSRRGESTFLDRARGYMAGATLSLNPRVALAQAASYPTAASELGWKALRKASGKFIKSHDLDLIAKYTPLLYNRSKGANIEASDIKKMSQVQNRVMRKLNWLMGWIEAIDKRTVGTLWYASQYYVQDNYSNLTVGSDEYYIKIAEEFNKVVERTQPNYTVMQRPDILRHPNALVKQLTMFMTQRLQNFNIVFESASRYVKYSSDLKNGINGVTNADVEESRKSLVRAINSQLVASATIVVMKFFVDALIHNMNGYRDKDKEITSESISFALMDNFLDTIIGNFLGGSELHSVLNSVIKSERYYGISINGVSAYSDAIEDFVKLAQKPSLNNCNELAKSVCTFLGIPLGNAEKIGKGIYYQIEDIANGEFGSFEAGVDRTTTQNIDRSYKAFTEGDMKKFNSITIESKYQSTVTKYLKELYFEAYDNKDDSTMANIRKYMKALGIYKNDISKTTQDWIKNRNK